MSGMAKMGWVAMCAVVWLGTGCDRWGGGPGSEEREANFIEGGNALLQGQTNKAIVSFERALHVNPSSAAAHVALADLFFGTADYTSAAYHYSRCRRLLEERGKTVDSTLSNRLESCELRLAIKYSDQLGRRQVDSQIEELRRQLTERDDALQKLQQELARWRPASNTAPATPLTTADPVVPPVTSRPAPSVVTPPPTTPVRPPVVAPVSSPSPRTVARTRTYTVRSGDTPAAIARKMGVSTRALMAANPGITPTRLKPGQVLNVP